MNFGCKVPQLLNSIGIIAKACTRAHAFFSYLFFFCSQWYFGTSVPKLGSTANGLICIVSSKVLVILHLPSLRIGRVR